MNRILVIGAGGAGKTAFARRLAQCTGLPLIHLDALYWRPGWKPTPSAEWQARIEELIRADRWIMDGNYEGTLDVRLRACDTIVFLDRGRLVCVWRVFVRWIRYVGRPRPELSDGCRERLTWEFLSWIWTYPSRRREGILRRLGSLKEQKRVVILRSGRAIEEFLDRVCEAAALAAGQLQLGAHLPIR